MKRGFTLIEILVAVSIIAILTTLGITNFMVANKKARDGRRQSDLEQIRAALEIYRTDERAYPITSEFPGAGGSLTGDDGSVYMQDIPGDPISDREYSYTSDAEGSNYTLCAGLELNTVEVAGCGSCGAGITCSYKVSSPL